MKIEKSRKNSAGFLLAILAITVFSLMLASQVIDYAGPGTVLSTMFPAAAFGFVHANLNSSIPGSQTSQAIGTPLPPGTVTYDNTWNITQPTSCTQTSTPSQPLEPVTGASSNIQLDIPIAVFMGKPTGSFDNESYRIYSNTTVVVNDSAGNSFGWSLVGLPSGSVSSTLTGNASEAIEKITVTSSASTVASLDISYSQSMVDCQPSGIEATVQGYVDWMNTNQTGKISFQFLTSPFSVNGTTDLVWQQIWYPVRIGLVE